LDVATEWRTITDGGVEDIEAWIVGTPEARLAIVDVLARVKGEDRGRDKGVYYAEYDLIGVFKAVAMRTGCAIVLVHHTNKGAAADPVLRVSGTMGLTGAADTVLVLSREANDLHGVLSVRGRDVPEREIALEFDKDTGCVVQLGAADDFRKSEERRAVLRVLADFGGPASPSEVANALGKRNGSWIRMLLGRMVRGDEIAKTQNGKYFSR
jgi:hypothetical protein